MNFNDRVAGLPVWAWTGLLLVGGYLLFRKSKSSSAPAAPAATAAPSGAAGTGAHMPAPSGVVAMPDYQMGIPLVAVAVDQPGAPGSLTGAGTGSAGTATSAASVLPSPAAAMAAPSGGGGGAGTGVVGGGGGNPSKKPLPPVHHHGGGSGDCKWAKDPSGKWQHVCPKAGHWVCTHKPEKGKKCHSWKWQGKPQGAKMVAHTTRNTPAADTINAPGANDTAQLTTLSGGHPSGEQQFPSANVPTLSPAEQTLTPEEVTA